MDCIRRYIAVHCKSMQCNSDAEKNASSTHNTESHICRNERETCARIKRQWENKNHQEKCKVQQNINVCNSSEKNCVVEVDRCFSCFVIKFKISYFRFLNSHRMHNSPTPDSYIPEKSSHFTRADSLTTHNTIKNSHSWIFFRPSFAKFSRFVSHFSAFSKFRRMMTYSAGYSLHPIIVHRSKQMGSLICFFLFFYECRWLFPRWRMTVSQ